MDLTKMADEVYEVNQANGWFDEDRGLEADVALLHSEVSELFEAYRSHGYDDFSAVRLRYGQRPPAEAEAILQRFQDAADLASMGLDEPRPDPLTPEERMTLCAAGVMKPEGVGSELADILIRLLDTAKRREWEIRQDIELSRRVIDADFVTMINELHAWVDNCREWDEAVAPAGFGYIFAIVHLIAGIAAVDLQAEYERKLAYNRTRGHRHGGKRL